MSLEEKAKQKVEKKQEQQEAARKYVKMCRKVLDEWDFLETDEETEWEDEQIEEYGWKIVEIFQEIHKSYVYDEPLLSPFQGLKEQDEKIQQVRFRLEENLKKEQMAECMNILMDDIEGLMIETITCIEKQ